MIRSIIIEDETLAARRLEAMISKQAADIQILTKLPSVKSAVAWLQSNAQPDLIFMDIHLDDGSSFDIFDQVKVSAPVIFTTAFDEYMIKAFKVNSIDYLLKPINQKELGFAIEKFRQLKQEGYYNNGQGAVDIKQLRQLALKARFMVTSGAKLLSIPVEDIAYFYSEDKITFLQTNKGGRYSLEHSLDKLFSFLDPAHWFKINRQLIVGIHAINTINKVSINRLKLTLKPALDKDIFVSIEKYSQFKDWLDS